MDIYRELNVELPKDIESVKESVHRFAKDVLRPAAVALDRMSRSARRDRARFAPEKSFQTGIPVGIPRRRPSHGNRRHGTAWARNACADRGDGLGIAAIWRSAFWPRVSRFPPPPRAAIRSFSKSSLSPISPIATAVSSDAGRSLSLSTAPMNWCWVRPSSTIPA